ncbi:DNA-binding SARP family transcriptional activator/LysM repeat protein [Actinoplanes octamycinicus]|uniref:DNA-binding SARP family transcriptional activator/LysM repeat protein n=1 Tax=Actinoplanes octamycinicus TaxID=135948 RepID=A0A7W7H4U6_9ACTN|nr:LysM peptidoglycan-binding domain-containing protein [Actinoplanes octamycinicus]MBB4744050.1 DNA-binding SARP family transcriptional activator/LysM repeat protein [Actinoplanes octamycinicus]
MRAGLMLFPILAGFPAGLVALAGSPLPSRLPTAAELDCWMGNPMQAQFLPGLLAAIAWLFWALAAIGWVRLAVRSSRRFARHLPGPAQSLAATVVGAAAVTAGYTPASAAPPAATTATATNPAPPIKQASADDPTCTVRHGDSLSKIAKQRLGDADRWPVIYKLNRGTSFPQVGGRLTDPDVIYPGWQLQLPDTATATASGNCTGKTAPKPHRPAEHDDGIATPPPTITPSHPGTVASPPAASGSDDDSGSAVTAGIAGLAMAAGFAYAGGLLWRRRRSAATSSKPATAPPAARPHPVAALTLLRRGSRPEPASRPRPALASPATAPPPAPTPVLASNPATALSGPGALGAARAALVALLTEATSGRAVVPGMTLDRLVPARPASDKIAVAADFPAALAVIDEEIIRRSRLLDENEDEPAPAEPPLLLLADVPEPTWHARLATAARLGAPLGIDVTLIGTWPSGTTLEVAADGATDAGDLAVLDSAAATELLHPAAPPATAPAPVTSTPAPQPAPARVVARVLGRPAILGPDGNPVRGLRTKALELFVYLVLNRDGAALSDIMEALWPDITLARATDRLSTCVANLRNTLRANAPGGDAKAKVEPVINTGGRYHLNPDLLDVDWWTILDAHTATTTAEDDQARLRHLRTAIDTAAGRSLADGAGYDWIGTDHERARRTLIRIHLQAATLLADTDPDGAHQLLETACGYDPMSEELARKAMQAAAGRNDPDGIRHRREQLHQALAEAGIDADTATDRFAADLLAQVGAAHR